MKNFHLFLADLPRRLHFPATLLECGYYTDALGCGSIKRGPTIEYGIRLAPEHQLTKDIVNGVSYRHDSPQLIVKTPGMLHVSNFEIPREVFFMVYPKSAIPFLKETGFKTDFAYLKLQDLDLVRACAQDIDTLRKTLFKKGTVDRIDLKAFQLLCEIFLKDNQTDELGYYDEKIIRIASELRQNFRDKINFDHLFHKHALSRRTFFRYWNRHFIISPKAYLEEMRMHESVRLLTETNLPVAEIAQRLPYPSTSYFCEHFKKQFNMTPLQFRKQRKQQG